MEFKQWQGLNIKESGVTKEIYSSRTSELGLIKRLLNSYLSGLEIVDHIVYSQENELYYAWLLLVIRSFNLMRSAYILLEKGYYESVIILLRSVYENWIVAADCEINPHTLSALLHKKERLGRGGLTFKKMSERVGVDKKWENEYGHLSTIAHPRYLALAVLIDSNTDILRLGPSYNKLLFLDCCENFIQSAVIMIRYLALLLKDKAQDWHDKTLPIVREANSLLKEWREKYERGENLI